MVRLLKKKTSGTGIARTSETSAVAEEAVRNQEENVRKRQKTSKAASTSTNKRRTRTPSPSSSSSSPSSPIVLVAVRSQRARSKGKEKDKEPDPSVSVADEEEDLFEFEASPQLPPPAPVPKKTSTSSVKGKNGSKSKVSVSAGKSSSVTNDTSREVLRGETSARKHPIKAYDKASRRSRTSSTSSTSTAFDPAEVEKERRRPPSRERQEAVGLVELEDDDDDFVAPSPQIPAPTPAPSSSSRLAGPKSRMSGKGKKNDHGRSVSRPRDSRSRSPPPSSSASGVVIGKKETSKTQKGKPAATKEKFHLKLKPRSSILEEESEEESTENRTARSYAGGRIEAATESSSTSRQSLSMLASSLADDGMSSMVQSNATTIVSNRSRRSSEGTAGSSSGMSRRSNLIAWSKEIVNEQAKEDQNDPDWLKFSEDVRNSPASAHERLATALLAAGTGTTSASALLAKLICRAVGEQDDQEDSQQSKEFYRKCAATILHAVLHITNCNDNRSSIVTDLLAMTISEMRHFPTSVLYSIGEHCMAYMKNDKDRDGCLPPRWIELFGKIVSIMILRGNIKHETDIIDGKAYQEYIVSGICRLKWTTVNSASLISVLKEIPKIDDSDLKLVICHVRSCVKDIKASGFPPVVHQLISLAGSRLPSDLLSICGEYFKADNAKTQLEVHQKRSALGTVVYHFIEEARHSELLIKAVIKVVKSSFFDFGQVMSPFMLSVVLGLTTLDFAKASIIEPLRSSILKTFHSMHLSESSYWYLQTAGCSKDSVTECFKAVLETKSSELEYMFDGLRELGVGLLNADLYQKQYPNTLQRCHELGSYIITSLVKSNEDQLPLVIKKLLEMSSKSVVHTECLAKCLEMKTRRIIHPSVIGSTCEIIRQLPMMRSDSASLIVKAMATALQLSYILLDQLMINLRKTIWKSVEARRTAARIMIILLSNSKVVGDIPNSQYSESQRFYESQNQAAPIPEVDLEQLPDNQPLCIEVLALTRRCFDQQVEIKKELYLGFHSVVRRNPGICELLCCQLYNHGKKFLSIPADDDENGPQIVMKKVVELPGNDSLNTVIIQEELGFMVQCLSHIVQKSYKAFAAVQGEPPEIVEELENLMGHWVKALLSLTPDTIEIAAAEAVGSAGGSRPLDTVRYVETAFTIQVLQIIEALIEFLNCKETREANSMVKKLFEKYKLLEPMLQKKKENLPNKKGKGEKGKGGKKTKKDKNKDVSNDDDVSVIDTVSEVSTVGGSKFKKPDAPKKLVYLHIFNLENLLEMLRKLYRPGSDKHPLTSVHRSSSEFEKMLLDTVKQKLASFKKKEPLHERSQREEKIEQAFANIAGCIWSGLCNHEDGDDAEGQIAADVMHMRLEIVSLIAEHLCSINSSTCCHLIKLFGDEVGDLSYEQAFPKFFNAWKTLLEWMPSNSEAEDGVNLHISLFDILLAFSKPMCPDSTQRTQLREAVNWVWTYMASSSGKGNQQAEFDLAESVISCWLAYYVKARGFLEQPAQSQHDVFSLSKTVRATLGPNQFVEESQEEIEHTPMWIINEDTASTGLIRIMDFIEVVLSHISALLVKVKSQQGDDEEALKNADVIRDRCYNMLTQILGVCSNLVPSGFPAGVFSTTMLKVIPQIFSVMTGFGEHLVELSKTKADYSLIKGFAGPVNLVGTAFKNSVELMIQHVESVQRKQVEEATAKALSTNKKKTAAAAVPSSVKNQMLQDKRLIPNMVYVMEKYDQQIITLSNRLKAHKGNKLIVGMKIQSGRDFKIDGSVLKDALKINRTRSVQDLTSVVDDETVHPNPRTPVAVAGPSRPRKSRKRKTTENETSHDD